MNNLKELMALNHINDTQLAQKTGIAKSNICRLRNNPEATPYNSTAQTLARALNCSVAQILGEKGATKGDKALLLKRCENAARAILDALRDYSDEPLFAHTGVTTHDDSAMRGHGDYIDIFVLNNRSIEDDSEDIEEVCATSFFIKRGEGL